MDLADRITSIIEPTLVDMGYELVRVRLAGDRRIELQIMAENVDGSGMDVEDCAKISRAVAALLDVEDPIKDAFNLEVSSPGIDRPLIKVKDFARFSGFEARIETTRPVDGKRRFKGLLGEVVDDRIAIATEDGNFVISHVDISRAKLLLTDELIAAASNKGLS